ncbi:MAG: aldehyde ferredoxin oxidoreductase family protein [Deltaproteobacteria bacterium]|nr:aldehyde ferredoxin oxidoreductase family protein [Deltaproteobacteria bacterium]
MFGSYGRILVVDVKDRSFEIEALSDEVSEKCIGGKGLATRLLLDRNPPEVSPFSEENHLIFATGPVCQGPLWGGSRYGVFTKSPLTGGYSESYSGGKVPEAIDSAGFDAVVIRGIAKAPTALSIHPEGCEFFDASDLWGADTYRSEEEARKLFAVVKEGFGKPGAVVIGPAGENLVRFAVIENDLWRSAGRTGVGTVMGAKKLKAIVFQGDRKRSLADPKEAAAYAKAFSKRNLEHPGVKAYRSLGTTMMVTVMNRAQAFPAKYWSQGTCEHWEKISGERFHREHEIKPNACLKCFMACGRKATLMSGRHKGLVIEGPEYETIYAFGGLCMIDDMGEIAFLNDLCDRLGMDTITAGNLCAFTIEAARQKKVDYPIKYGDASGVATLLTLIAERKGIGDVLAEGIVNAAKAWDLEEFAVHVKGMEPAGYEPRVLKGMGLAYATSDRGACHLRTTFYKAELAGLIAPDAIQGKAEMLIDYEDRLNIFDSLILCRFYRDIYPWEELEKIVTLTTGKHLSTRDLREKAAFIADMTRSFNLREGLKPDRDRLPRRFCREALPSGHTITEKELATMVKEYYGFRGWDEGGVPKRLL